MNLKHGTCTHTNTRTHNNNNQNKQFNYLASVSSVRRSFIHSNERFGCFYLAEMVHFIQVHTTTRTLTHCLYCSMGFYREHNNNNRFDVKQTTISIPMHSPYHTHSPASDRVCVCDDYMWAIRIQLNGRVTCCFRSCWFAFVKVHTYIEHGPPFQRKLWTMLNGAQSRIRIYEMMNALVGIGVRLHIAVSFMREMFPKISLYRL